MLKSVEQNFERLVSYLQSISCFQFQVNRRLQNVLKNLLLFIVLISSKLMIEFPLHYSPVSNCFLIFRHCRTQLIEMITATEKNKKHAVIARISVISCQSHKSISFSRDAAASDAESDSIVLNILWGSLINNIQYQYANCSQIYFFVFHTFLTFVLSVAMIIDLFQSISTELIGRQMVSKCR